MARRLFTSSSTWVCPDGVSAVRAFCMGGGGAGGGVASSGGTSRAAGGNGAGGAAGFLLVNVTPGTSYTVTVGLGGTGVVGLAGNNGGDSWFSTNTTVVGGGGGGGGGSTANTPAGTQGAQSTFSGVGVSGQKGGVPGTSSTSGGSSAGASGSGSSGAGISAAGNIVAIAGPAGNNSTTITAGAVPNNIYSTAPSPFNTLGQGAGGVAGVGSSGQQSATGFQAKSGGTNISNLFGTAGGGGSGARGTSLSSSTATAGGRGGDGCVVLAWEIAGSVGFFA